MERGRWRTGSRVTLAAALAGSMLGAGALSANASAGSPGRFLWLGRYSASFGTEDSPRSVAVAPNGSTVVAAGCTHGGGSPYAYAVVGFDAQTGGLRWTNRFDPGSSCYPASLAVAPDGGRVFMAGERDTANAAELGVWALDIATGDRIWSAGYRGPARQRDSANAVTVSPDSGTVFVAGQSVSADHANDYVTLAYDAATGQQRWVERYRGPRQGSEDAATAVVPSPDGSSLYVTGWSGFGDGNLEDFTTIAYDAGTGHQRWLAAFGTPENRDWAWDEVVSGDGARLFVTGQSNPSFTGGPGSTVAYDTATGQQLWSRTVAGCCTSIALTPDDGTAVVTGGRILAALDAETGEPRWRGRGGTDVATDPADGSVYLTGSVGSTGAWRIVTETLDPATGSLRWRRGSPPADCNAALDVAAQPGGGRVYTLAQIPDVAGECGVEFGVGDFGVLAYATT